MYQKTGKYYSDFYDRHTVERCREIEHQYAEDIDKEAGEIKISPSADLVMHQLLYFFAGDRYLGKEKTTNNWMERDEDKDKKLKNATPPDNITCDTCGSAMTYKDKTFDTSDSKRVMFFFTCPNNHLPHKYVYSDSTAWRKNPVLCPDCDSKLKEKSTKSDKKIVTKYSCANCGYSDTDTINLETKDQSKEDPYFEEDRQRFCLSKEAGEAYRDERHSIEQMSELERKWEDETEHKEEKSRADATERLTVPHIKRKVRSLSEEKDLEAIKFDDLEVSPQSTYLKFSVEDPQATKENYRKRCLDFKKDIEGDLKDTNWRLMSKGISYHLGIMSGRLRVYESDDDIYNLIKREN